MELKAGLILITRRSTIVNQAIALRKRTILFGVEGASGGSRWRGGRYRVFVLRQTVKGKELR
jgi:hypothetical protein